MSTGTLSLVTAIVGLAVASLITLLTVRSSSSAISQRGKGYNRINLNDEGLYEDEDGTATEDSQDAYSVRRPKILTTICAVVAVLASLISIVWTTLKPAKSPVLPSWLMFGGWVSYLNSVDNKDTMADLSAVLGFGANRGTASRTSPNPAFFHRDMDILFEHFLGTVYWH